MDVPFIGGFFTNTRGQRYGPLVRKKKLSAAGNSIVSRTPYDTSTKSGARNVSGGIRQKSDDFLSFVEKRANMPRKPSRPKRVPGGKRSRVKPTLRRSTKKRKLKRKAPPGAKRPSKKLKVSATKYHNHRYEQEGTCNSTQPFMYVGINDCHKRDAIWDAMADALLRPILAKECKFRPLQDTDKIGNIQSNTVPITLVFDFKRVTGITGANNTIESLGAINPTVAPSDVNLALCRVDLDDVTYEGMRTRMSTILKFWADGTNSVDPASDTVAYFPFKYHATSTQNTSAATMSGYISSTFEHLGDTMIDLSFVQKTVFVNRTLAEGGGTDGQFTDRLGTNPLKGKVYQFNHSNPRVLDHVDMSAALRTSIQSDQLYGMTRYQSTDILDTHLAHPLAAKFWLKNCVKESSFMLKPGGYMSHDTSKSIKGKLSSLIERFYFSGFDKGTFGQSSLIMFDMVNHTSTSQLPTTTYKRSCVVKSAGKLQTPKLYIPDFEASVMTV